MYTLLIVLSLLFPPSSSREHLPPGHQLPFAFERPELPPVEDLSSDAIKK